MDYQLSAHFYAYEFVCRCGKCELSDPKVIMDKIDPLLIEKLETTRVITELPIIVTAGVRCWGRQIQIYKERYKEFWESHIVKNSKHFLNKETGIFEACDIICSMGLFQVSMIAARSGFNEVGWYRRNQSGIITDYFIHAGTRKDRNNYYRKIYNF